MGSTKCMGVKCRVSKIGHVKGAQATDQSLGHEWDWWFSSWFIDGVWLITRWNQPRNLEMHEKFIWQLLISWTSRAAARARIRCCECQRNGSEGSKRPGQRLEIDFSSTFVWFCFKRRQRPKWQWHWSSENKKHIWECRCYAASSVLMCSKVFCICIINYATK
jgi:hypothetical protein